MRKLSKREQQHVGSVIAGAIILVTVLLVKEVLIYLEFINP